MKTSFKLKNTRTGEKIIISLFIFLAFITIFPIWYVLMGSFNQGADYSRGGVIFFPRHFTLDNYMYVFMEKRIWRAYAITIGRTVLGTTLHVVITFLVAYGMSRPRVKFRKFFYTLMIITMFFGGGLIPYYVWMSITGLLNTFWIYVLPKMFSVYNMLVFMSFIRSLPSELYEAATIDGAGEYRICFQIIFNCCKPVIATIILWQTLAHWNNYFDSMYYVINKDLYTLQYVLKVMLNDLSVSENSLISPEVLETMSPTVISYAAIFVITMPIFIVYPILQKQFQKGFMLGSLKG